MFLERKWSCEIKTTKSRLSKKTKLMIRQTSTIALLFILKMAMAQNPNLEFKKALKIYNLTTYEEKTYNLPLNNGTTSDYKRYTSYSLQILHPTVAFQWTTEKQNFHEIELTSFVLGKTSSKTELIMDSSQTIITSGNDITKTDIGLQYEYIVNFNKSKDHKLVPALGFGANPYFEQNFNAPMIAQSFETRETCFGVRAFITPRVTYYFNEKLFMDFNIPLYLFDLSIQTNYVGNPAAPKELNTASRLNLEQPAKILGARIGIGMKI